MTKVLMKGNEAVAKAAIEAGCRLFAGYPITPQNEVPEYFAKELPKVGGVFIQAESEVAAINMIYGAAAAGARAMTSSSSPGIALKQEGIGYLTKAEMPAVIVNMMRGGPGLGGIQPSQSDYHMCVKGGANGDYHNIVLAPGNLQEAVDLIMEGFELADAYRTPVMILADGMIGQMMEPVEFRQPKKRDLPPKDWALTGKNGGEKHCVLNLEMEPLDLEAFNVRMYKKYKEIEEKEQLWEEYMMEDAEYAFVAYGTAARVAKSAIGTLRKEGYKIGCIRPKSLWPFPVKAFENRGNNIKKYICVELSMGQMVDDVCLACNDKNMVEFIGRTGGIVIKPQEVIEFAKRVMGEVK